MKSIKRLTPHTVDILANVIGRDQPIMLIDKAIELIMHLGEDTLISDDVIFIDPFCKAGEILLACAVSKCLVSTQNSNLSYDLAAIKKEIYASNRYYGLSPDERHHRLSLRTFLGNECSHDKKLNYIIKNGNYLSEIDGKLDKEQFDKELITMLEYIKNTNKDKKIIAVGNPPYQESDSGFGKSAKSIYNYFVESLINNNMISEFVLVIPARWFGGGKGLDDFRRLIMESKRIRAIKYFKNSSNVFPTVDINGGLCFLNYQNKEVDCTQYSDGDKSIEIDINEFDIVIDDPFGYDLIRKVNKKWKDKYVGDVAWSRNAFGLETNYFTKNKEANKNGKNSVPCLTRNRITKYVDINNIKKNMDKIDYWKVCVPAAAGGSKGKRRSTIPINQIFLIEKGVITTETYSVIDIFNDKEKAENLVSYLKTDFARYLLGLRKITQHIPKDRWNWVPYVDISKKWTDKDLFKYFNVTDSEQAHIKQKVAEWS